jgi:hypothetical protein
MIVLPAITLMLFFLVLRRKGIGTRRAFLAAATMCGTSVVLITEFLSVPRLVTRSGVGLSWTLISLILLVMYLRLPRLPANMPLERKSEVESPTETLDRTEKLLLFTGGVIVLLVGITALIAPPAGEDVISYHMPRVAMWINNHNVRFFPTRSYPQLILGVFAEYSIMHTMLLWGSDRFANMVQFFSFAGCAIAASYIAKLMGGRVRAQMLAAIISITIPQGILEASGSMNTYTTAFWIVTTTAFLLAWNEHASWLNTICIGLAAGLALLTKGTSYIMLPFIVLACWWIGPPSQRILFLKRSVIFVALILAINAPQYFRNYEFDGSPLGLPLNYGELNLTVKHITVKSTAANILRNISSHTGTPEQLWSTERGFRAAIKFIGVDPDDPDQILWGNRFMVNQLSFNEVVAGNPLHLILLMAALLIIFARLKQTANRDLVWYSGGLVMAFTAFCAVLKWQRWSSRYYLAFFVLGGVIIAMVLVRHAPRKVGTAIAILLLGSGLLNASLNRFRSLLPVGRGQTAYGPRATMYFTYHNEYLGPSYIAAAAAVNKTDCASVGIDSYTPLSDLEIKHDPTSFFTYPILALIHADGRTRTAWFSSVHNLTARYAAQQPHPPACAIICLGCAKAPNKWQEYGSFPNHLIFEDAIVFTTAGNLHD